MKIFYHCVKYENLSDVRYWTNDNYLTLKVDDDFPECFLVSAAEMLAGDNGFNFIGHEISRDDEKIFVTLLSDIAPPEVKTWANAKSSRDFCLSLDVKHCVSMTRDNFDDQDISNGAKLLHMALSGSHRTNGACRANDGQSLDCLIDEMRGKFEANINNFLR